jgi:hypothetical protein
MIFRACFSDACMFDFFLWFSRRRCVEAKGPRVFFDAHRVDGRGDGKRKNRHFLPLELGLRTCHSRPSFVFVRTNLALFVKRKGVSYVVKQ